MYDHLNPGAALERAAYRFGECYEVLGDDANDSRNDLLRAALRFYRDQQQVPRQRDLRPVAPDTVILNTPDNPKLHGKTMLVDKAQTHYRGLVGTIPELFHQEGRVFYDVTWDQVREQPT